MKILPMTYEQGQERSRAEALSRGCNGVTKYWWSVCNQGIMISDDYSGLTEQEISSLVEYVPDDE